MEKNNSLEELSLGRTYYNTSLILHLQNLTVCSENKIGDEGVRHLARALQYNSTLKEIYLHDNGITVEGTRVLAYVLPQTSIVAIDLMGAPNGF